MIGELHVRSGIISSSGRIAYVSQNPWIQTGTVRENIVFGQKYDKDKYTKVSLCVKGVLNSAQN